MKAWHRLRHHLVRKYGPFEYVSVKEEGKRTGMKHLHLILAGPGATYIPQIHLSLLWARLAGAPVVDIRRVRGDLLPQYLAKYLAKQVRERKQLTFSRRWPKEPPPPPSPHAQTIEVGLAGPPYGMTHPGPLGMRYLEWCVVCLGPGPPPQSGNGRAGHPAGH